MHVAVTNRDHATSLVTIQGSLDLTTAPQLRAAMHTLLDTGRIRIVIDLAGVDFCDSIGLGTFVYGHNHCHANGGFLRLAGPSPFLSRLLRTVGLTGPIPVYPTVAAALAAVPGLAEPTGQPRAAQPPRQPGPGRALGEPYRTDEPRADPARERSRHTNPRCDNTPA